MSFPVSGGIPAKGPDSPKPNSNTSHSEDSASVEPKLNEEMERPPAPKPPNEDASIQKKERARAHFTISSQRSPAPRNPVLRSPVPQLPVLPNLPPQPPISQSSGPAQATPIPQIHPQITQLEKSKITNLEKPKKAGFLGALNAGLSVLSKADKTGPHNQPTSLTMLGIGEKMIENYARDVNTLSASYESFADKLNQLQSSDPKITTTMLKLYDIAADKKEAEKEPFEAFRIRQKAANNLLFDKSHSLHQMSKSINQNNKTLYGPCGLQLEGGTSHAARGLVLQTRPHEDGHPRDVLNFEISMQGREALSSRLQTISQNLMVFNAFLPANLGSLSIPPVSQGATFQGRDEKGNLSLKKELGFSTPLAENQALQFISKGKVVGQVIIGSNADHDLPYRSVQVEVLSDQANGEGVKTMQQMMTVLGLGPILGEPLDQDRERINIGLIAHSYFPQSWVEVQKLKNFHSMSPDEIRESLIEHLPSNKQASAQELLQKYSKPGLIGTTEVIPGKVVPTLNDLSQHMQDQGLIGFVSGVGNSAALAGICKFGFLSTEMRLQMGLMTPSASPWEDMASGGARSIFVRAVNEEVMSTPFPDKPWRTLGGRQKNVEFRHPKTNERELEEVNAPDKNWQFSGKFQVIMQPEIINGGGYGFHGDWYGVCGEKSQNYIVYQQRDNLIDFSSKLGKAQDKFSTKADHLNEQGEVVDAQGHLIADPHKGTLNEVGIPGGCIAPRHFIGINCISQEAKQELLREFQNRGMLKNIKTDSQGNITDATILLTGVPQGVAANDFIHVGNQLKKEMWNQKK